MKKILVIDDDSSIRENIRRLLTHMNYEIELSSSGSEGITAAAQKRPDLIICDVMMPEVDGYEVLQSLSCRQETSSIPFVFLTGRADMADLRYGMDLGADDYLVKPYKSADLIRAIETRLKKKERLEEIKNEVEKAEKPSLHLDYDSVILAGTPPEVLKIMNIIYIKASDVYTEVFLYSGKKLLVRKLLKEWEAILPEHHFLRIHNSTIINLEYMDKVEKWFNNTLRIHMRTIKEALEVSKRYTVKVRAALKI